MRALSSGLATLFCLRAEPRASACATAVALLVGACSYEPVAGPIEPRRISTEPAELLGTLDARGEYALLGRLDASGAPLIAISRWREQEECVLPEGPQTLLSSPGARPAGRKGPALYAPAGVPRNEHDTELVLVDEQCRVHEGYGLVKTNTVRTIISGVDERPLFLYRDAADTLYVVDPYVSLAPRALAENVVRMRPSTSTSKSPEDVLWLIEAGQLTQRDLDDGQRHVALGSDVSTLVVHSDARRVAFVDEGTLFEAIAPDFAPKRLADAACSPRYSGDNLEFYAPCDSESLVRIRISNGKIQTFEEGVFASSMQEGVQLDFVHTEDDQPQLVVQFEDAERMPVTPHFGAGNVYVLDDQHLAGLDVEQRFGVWERDSQRFAPMFDGVEEMVPHRRGKIHSYSFLLHHDLDEQGLGTLTLFQEQDMRSVPIARGVPRSAQGGFRIENGDALPNYPFSTPLLIVLEEASPVAERPERFRGRLRALTMRGEPSVSLAEDVSSYLLVATPVPGVLYSVDTGADRGLWFVAL